MGNKAYCLEHTGTANELYEYIASAKWARARKLCFTAFCRCKLRPVLLFSWPRLARPTLRVGSDDLGGEGGREVAPTWDGW